MSTQSQRVLDYYKNTRLDYRLLWTGRDTLAVHFGYYDSDVKNHAESLLRMNEVLANSVQISSRDTVLDAGCGYGGSSIWLSKNRGCQAVGLTIVPEQVTRGNRYARKYGVADRVRLLYGDYTHVPFRDQSFEVVWGLESFVHAEDRKTVYREAYRVLKDGGRLVIAEYLLREDPPLSKKEQKILEPWLRGWAMPKLITPHQYQDYLQSTRFSNVQLQDITEFTKPSLKRLERMAGLALPVAYGLTRLRIFNVVRYGNVEGSYYQNKALGQGLWNYWIVTARK